GHSLAAQRNINILQPHSKPVKVCHDGWVGCLGLSTAKSQKGRQQTCDNCGRPPSDQGPANRKGKESAETSKTAKQRATDSTDTDQLQRFSANPRLDLSTNFNPKLDMIGDLLFPSSASGGLPSNPTDKAMTPTINFSPDFASLD
ncbi:hypothetical protein CTAM01_12266, partial [Colletotrichum tamarilloi]